MQNDHTVKNQHASSKQPAVSDPDKIDVSSPSLFQQQLFMAYNYYHTVLSGVILLLFVINFDLIPLGYEKPQIFLYTSIIFFTLSVLLTLLFKTFAKPQTDVVLFVLFIDINLITGLMYASGGVESGLGSLLVLTVGAASLLALDIRGILMAAMATIAVILDEHLVSQYNTLSSKNLLQTGTLGIIFFATAYLLQTIAKRLQASEFKAEKQASSIANLEKLNEMIVQRMTTGVIVYSQTNGILLINEAAKELLAFSHSTSLPQPLQEAYQMWCTDEKPTTPYEFQLLPHKNQFSSHFISVNDDNAQNTLMFIEDQSRIHEEAQKIKLASLGRLTASIAHEIRNPLSAINHASQLLRESPTLDPADTRMTEIIENHCLRMNTIIENVLELSRRKPSKKESLSLDAWNTQFLEDIEATALGQGHFEYLPFDEDLKVIFDSEQLHQIVSNLCQNALRHSKTVEDASPLVQLHVSKNLQNQPELSVLDNGPGIDESIVPQIFEPFFTTATTGSGLGLYICRELCESNNARLEYASRPSGGSCFKITFRATDAN